MLSKTHKLTEALTTAIGPVLREHSDYHIIQQAMGLVLARIAQSTPEVGQEHYELEIIYEYAKQALTEFLRIEAAKKAKLDEGINGFARMFETDPAAGLVALNGGMGTEAQAAAEEAQEYWSESPIHQAVQDWETSDEFLAIEKADAEKQGMSVEEYRESEKDLKDYYNDRCTLEDMQARRERRATSQNIKTIQEEEAEQAWNDTLKED